MDKRGQTRPRSVRTGSASVRGKGRAAGGPGSRFLRWARRIAIALVVLTLLGVSAVAFAIWYYGRDLPTVETLRSYTPPQTTRVVDRNGQLIGEIFTERRTVVPMERIPRVLVLSVLAAEDADFYVHEGLDYPGLVRAVIRGVLSGEQPRGTSTITQQLVKLMLLSPEQTIARKVKELILARRLEQELTKDEILHLYLNHINFGHGRYGVQEAARYYFGKDVDDLTLAEASLIAGVPQSPSHLSPRSHPEAARRRQRFVLDQLEAKREEHWPDLTLDEIRAAREATVVLAPPPEGSDDAPEVLALAREVLRSQVGDEAFDRGGYVVHTTVDLDLQSRARGALRTGLEALDARHSYRGPLHPPRRHRPLEPAEEIRAGHSYDAVVTGADDDALLLDVGGHPARASIPARYNPDGLAPRAFAEDGARLRVSLEQAADVEDPEAAADVRIELGPDGAVVVIDPRTRDVLALVGGYEKIAGFDRAMSALRQPGSTFKPVVYALGIRSRRFTPATIVLDAPAVYDEWRPQNYEVWSYEGAIRLREALARSINSVAVRVIEDVSPPETVDFARRLGITSELDPSLALALGASDVTPIELANAYATFAAGGRWEPTRLIRASRAAGERPTSRCRRASRRATS